MRGWRGWRFLGIHLLTWIALASGLTVAAVAQLCEGGSENYWGSSGLGWPMQWSAGVPPTSCDWIAAGVNFAFYSAVVASSAFVCERLVRSWEKPWQISLAAILWVSSILGATLAIAGQDYLPIIHDAFNYLKLRARGSDYLPRYAMYPTYFALGCFLYLCADTTLRLCRGMLSRD
jgi:hypothetical protein